jgi:hypothetical protein
MDDVYPRQMKTPHHTLSPRTGTGKGEGIFKAA